MIQMHDVFLHNCKILDRANKNNVCENLTPEYKFHPKRKWRFDFADVTKMIAIECDGGTKLYGGGRHNSDKDREKLNEATILGWRVLRFSSEQIKKNPVYCYNCVLRALG